jgi:tripartite-type tricarboxylate transporter receptor subunit TctC
MNPLRRSWVGHASAGAALALVVCAAPPLRADEIADFYKGKTINLLIGVGVGGEYDTNARLTGRHIGKHIPDHPNVVAQNMIGASGVKMANHLFLQAPKDGTYLGALSNNLPQRQVMGDKGVHFDASQFGWIGSISPTVLTLVTWHTTGIKTLADTKRRDVVIGTSSRGSIHYILCAVLQDFTGARLKMVTGYKSGSAMNLAVERGEIDGRVNTWSSVKVTKPDWISEHKIFVLMQTGAKARDLPNVPSLEDLARNDEERQLVQLLGSAEQLGRPLVTTPGVPAARLAALRKAFDETMTDPAFLEDAKKGHVEVDPVTGRELQDIVAKVMKTPPAVLARAKSFLE